MYSRIEVAECAKRVNRSVPTIWRWIKAGCRIDDPASLEAFRIQMERKKTNIAKARERRAKEQKAPAAGQSAGLGVHTVAAGASGTAGNGEIPPAGQKGAQHALARLESQEAEAYSRLQLALERGDPIAIEQCQQFWVRCVESLRKLDLSIELARRDTEQMLPLRVAQESVLACADWFRISFAVFLSSEGKALQAIRDFGEWKAYAAQRFVGILHMTLRGSLSTRSPVPSWAAEKIRESWNVQ